MNVRRFLSAATALTVAGTLLAFSTGDLPALAAEPDDSAESIPTDTSGVTASELELVPVAADPEFAQPRALSRFEADEQLEDVLDASEFATEEQTNGGIARATLNSDIAIVGVTWDANQANPASVELRRLEGGEWTAWQKMVLEELPDFVDPEEVQISGTHPVTLTNVEAVEVIAHDEDDRLIEGITVNVIDPRGAEPVDNEAERDRDDELQEPELDLEVDTPEPEQREEDRDGDEDRAPENEPQSVETDEPDEADAEDRDEPAGDELLDLDGVTETEPSSFAAPLLTKLTSNGTVYDTGMNGLKVTTRKGWGANESHRNGFVDIQVKYKGAVVHHTEGSNTYTQAQVPGQLQGIYYYHAVTRDWGDIGYQFLVDKFGGVWEGRFGTLSGSPRGAQAYGANSETFGISILGSYMTQPPPKVAEDALAKTIAWQFKERGISNPKGTIQVPGSDLKGRTVNTISAHRDVTATDCPGDALYARMPQIRNSVVEFSKVTPAPKPPEETGKGWNPANVISDAAFYNPNTMTEAQIQTFLNKEGASCKPGSGTSCLKDKKFPTKKLTTLRGGCKPFNLTGNQSAAKIISETSKSCDINPQVILATLQKEQSGITQPRTDATWAKAMGAGCPDGQPCDSTLGGFAQQIYYGADKLVSYRINATWEEYILAYEAGKSIKIPHNPDARCGTETVKIENYATASLYMYTPYVGASKTSGCSTIGAKSFYDIMNRYFPDSLGGEGSVPDPKPDPKPQEPSRGKWQARKQIGHGWTDSVIHAGDWNRDGRSDLMWIDQSGRLWFYPGKGSGGFSARKQIGHGWLMMDKVIGGVDWDGDGNVDLIARVRANGELRIYPGDGRGGFKAAKKIGQGWQGMSDLTVAQTSKGPAIYALSRAGKLYLYPGNGKGEFLNRSDLGGSWSETKIISAAGDWTGNGHADLLSVDSRGDLFLHGGLSGGKLGTTHKIGNGWNNMRAVDVSLNRSVKAPIWSVDTGGKLWSYTFIGLK